MISNPIGYIDSFLNRITMYRLMLYYLIVLTVSAAFFGNLGFLPYNLQDLLIGVVIVFGAGYISNYLFSKIFKAETNIESVFITSLILVLIMPVGFPKDSLFLVLASIIAMASKYILAFNKRHIFNPAAVSAVIMSIFFGYAASWWVGTSVMFPLIALGGLLVIRKTQKEKLAAVFIGAFLFIVGVGILFTTRSLETAFIAWRISLFESALPFFVLIMLIEPLTSPFRKKQQIYFSLLVSFIYATTQVGIINLAITPEMALLIGNIIAYLAYPNYRLILSLKNKLKLSKDTYSFIFKKQNNFKFIPGQYMEWTISGKNADSRGNRRYFTFSSSPTEKEIAITVKFYEPSSTYKKELLNFGNKKITASQVGGDFILPQNLNLPIVFIAGGVGITPFRSMVKYIIDKNLKTDIVLIYSNKTKDEILFADIFKTAEKNGIKTVYFLTDETNIPKNWQGMKGHISEEGIKEAVPDYWKRIFYISGPQLMVKNFEKILTRMGIFKSKIKTDFFPGYAESK